VEVILLEHLETLGRRGDVVRVKPGYARNFLLPRRLAMLATPGAKRLVAQEARKFAVLDQRARTDAEAIAQRLGELELQIPARADDDGKLYGSVSAADVAKLLLEKGVEVDRRRVLVDPPIKALGSYDLSVKLHQDVRGHVKLHVIAETS
jgi:large subunit ribosomal protein L9